MEPVYLLNLASRKTAWLAARQATIASNIANQNTPGYKAMDVAPFQDVMDKTRLDMTATNPSDLSLAATGSGGAATRAEDGNDFDMTESGNSVGLEGEMSKASEVNREYALTTNLVKSFHSMLMAALKA
jgi:flagellar basal-body rod protein FlgB